MLTKQLPCTLTSATPDGPDEDSVTILTSARDLMRDSIDPLEMETATYLRGPAAVNFAHDHSRLPVAKTLALAKNAAGIRATFRWRTDPDSQAVKSAFDDGVLGASVEFVVPDGGAIPNSHGGFYFKRTILTGWALTGNPANPQCVKVFKALRWTRPTMPITRPATLGDIERALRGQALDAEVRWALAQRSPAVVELIRRTASAALVELVEPEIDRTLNRLRGRVE